MSTSSILSSFIFCLDGNHSPSQNIVQSSWKIRDNNNQFGISSGISCFRVASEFKSWYNNPLEADNAKANESNEAKADEANEANVANEADAVDANEDDDANEADLANKADVEAILNNNAVLDKAILIDNAAKKAIAAVDSAIAHFCYRCIRISAQYSGHCWGKWWLIVRFSLTKYD